MISTSTECKTCIHRCVCSKRGKPEMAVDKLNNNYYVDENDECSWDKKMEEYGITIVISCNDYSKQVPNPRDLI